MLFQIKPVMRRLVASQVQFLERTWLLVQQVKDLDSALLVPVEVAEQSELLEHRVVEDLKQRRELNSRE